MTIDLTPDYAEHIIERVKKMLKFIEKVREKYGNEFEYTLKD